MWHLWLILAATVLLLAWLRGNKNSSTKRVCILVLGDIGRSPRMQYHALSCAKNGFEVDLIGFGGKNQQVYSITASKSRAVPSMRGRWVSRVHNYIRKEN